MSAAISLSLEAGCRILIKRRVRISFMVCGSTHISVFVFQERSLPARLNDSSLKPGKFSFNMETWSQGNLRYFVIDDANAANIDSLARLFKTTS